MATSDPPLQSRVFHLEAFCRGVALAHLRCKGGCCGFSSLCEDDGVGRSVITELLQHQLKGDIPPSSNSSLPGRRVTCSPPLQLCVTHIFGALLLLKKMLGFLVPALGWEAVA